MKKLNYSRASYYMAGRFKEIRSEIKSLARHQNFAGVMQALVNHIKSLQAMGQEAKVKRYICYVGKIYSRGNDYVQYIIENLFVRSLGSLQRRASPTSWQAVMCGMPKAFTEIYQKQVNEQIFKK